NQVQTVLEDLHNEKQMLAEQKVQIKVNAVKELKETKAKLVQEQAKIASKFLEKIITEEMTQLKDELQKAKENNFGRKIFEAYFAEYATTFFNEKEEVKKLQSKIQEGEAKLAEAKEEIEKQGKLISESQN